MPRLRSEFAPALLLPLLLLQASGCGAPPAAVDGGNGGDAALQLDAGSGDAQLAALQASESYEHAIDHGWLAAGQPTQTRLLEVIGQGARILSLRPQSEDPFDEAQLVADAGGEFGRHPTTSADLQLSSFREGLYDRYDGEVARGGLLYLHCASGNRVGATWALYHAERLGMDPEQAIAIGRSAGLSGLEQTVRDILGI